MSRKKRSLKEMRNESSDDADDTQPQPPTKKQKTGKTTSAAVAVAKKSTKGTLDLRVVKHESIAMVTPKATTSDIKACSKIAAFDMDWTLIKPKGKAKFPQSRSDWVWLYGNVTSKLKALYADGHQIVIFSNQNGVGTGKQKLGDVTGKIIDMANQLGLPVFAVLSTEKDHWRKPNPSMWDYFVSHYQREFNASVDLSASFYCGDAAGRPKAWRDKQTKKDFSCSDRKFALNVGVAFHTPESFFLGHAEHANWQYLSLNPKDYLAENSALSVENVASWFHGKLPIAKEKGDHALDLVVMRGPPGCGKTRFVNTHLVTKGYARINRDTLKTQKKCLDAVRDALTSGQNCVVDNTNPGPNARAAYIEIAQQCKAQVRLFDMKVEREVAEHQNLVREKATKGQVKRIPTMVYNIFYKKCRESAPPNAKEGIHEIVAVDFVPSFDSDEEKKLWAQFT